MSKSKNSKYYREMDDDAESLKAPAWKDDKKKRDEKRLKANLRKLDDASSHSRDE